MLIALTFLGTGNYQETTYIKHDDEAKTCKTDLFPIAVARLYKPNQIIAFTTPKVIDEKQDDLNKLKREFGDKFSTEEIPNGNSPEELWEIFNKCINVFDDNENDAEVKIILDITHAFRSIPLLIFIVAAYLRQVKNIELEHIIYGAFEARDQDANETRIFDLTPFVELLDWMNAVNVFQNYGDARPIAKLNVQDKIAKTLTNLSDALLTNRTLEAQKAAMIFNGLPLDLPQEPPFEMLVKQLRQSYSQMAVNEPDNNQKNSLKAQYQQIKWYIDNQHYLQAITLMREWLISYEYLQVEGRQGHWLSQAPRKDAENVLNDSPRQQQSQLAGELIQRGLANQDSIKTELWTECNEIRRDLAHCGMRQNPENAARAIQRIRKLFSEFKDFVKSIGYV